jgi:hypothetical protein
METQKNIKNEKQEWQQPVLEVIASERTELDSNPGDDGLGIFTQS